MSSDFSARGRSVMESIAVPALSMEAIRRRSHRDRRRGRVRAAAACAVLSLGAVGAGVGAKLYDGVHVWLAGGKVTAVVPSGMLMREPTAPELRNAIAHATFPVVFPVGVPAGSRANMVTLAPLGRPSAITISYQGPGFTAAFALADPAVVDADGAAPSDPALPPMRAAYHFRVGGEVVVVSAKGISAADLDRIKVAMAKTSPAESLAQTARMLPKLTVLGGAVRLDPAERVRPANGSSVLLDEASIRSIPGLIEKAKPMYDWRITSIDKVGYKNGAMATGAADRRPRAIAISADGVRAIDAFLRSPAERGHRGACGCEILYHQPNRATYWVWKIPLSSHGTARKYLVDAKTLAVTPARETGAR